jgi:hypothetical protein
VRRGTEFENLDEGHRFALALTDVVAGGPDHDGGHGMRTRLRDDHPADALPAGPASTLRAVTQSGGDTYLVAIALTIEQRHRPATSTPNSSTTAGSRAGQPSHAHPGDVGRTDPHHDHLAGAGGMHARAGALGLPTALDAVAESAQQPIGA